MLGYGRKASGSGLNSYILVRRIILGTVITLLVISSVIYMNFVISFGQHPSDNFLAREWNENEMLYPKKSLIDDYPTAAIEHEIQKHDRLVVQGMSYMHKLSYEDMKLWTPTADEKKQRQVCMNIFVCNRDVPYIDVMMMGLMRGNTRARLNSYLQINLLNTERNPERIAFPKMTDKLSRLPFVNVYNFSANSSLNAPTFRQQFFNDTIRGLEICDDSGLDWCLMIEEDAVTPVGFIDQLDEFVIKQLAGKKDKISVVSLYAYYNPKYFGDRRLRLPKYSRDRYHSDRAVSNAERRARRMVPYRPFFEIKQDTYPMGTVALLYSKSAVKKLLSYLRQIDELETDTDVYINTAKYFPKFAGFPRLQVEPSLVNHIGYYSARMGKLEGPMFTQLNTDVRFQFDAGEYTVESQDIK